MARAQQHGTQCNKPSARRHVCGETDIVEHGELGAAQACQRAGSNEAPQQYFAHWDSSRGRCRRRIFTDTAQPEAKARYRVGAIGQPVLGTLAR